MQWTRTGVRRKHMLLALHRALVLTGEGGREGERERGRERERERGREGERERGREGEVEEESVWVLPSLRAGMSQWNTAQSVTETSEWLQDQNHHNCEGLQYIIQAHMYMYILLVYMYM